MPEYDLPDMVRPVGHQSAIPKKPAPGPDPGRDTGLRKKSCSNSRLERDGEAKKSYLARGLERETHMRGVVERDQMQTIDVICPVFREEEVIGLFHDRLSAVLAPLGQRYAIRVLYVLDPSPDRTEMVLSAIAANDPRVEVLVM